MGFLNLFQSKKKTGWQQISNRDARVDEVNKLCDQTKLVDIAKNDVDWYIRKAATSRLEDQDALQYIAKHDYHEFVRMDAVNKLKDQSFLADIARNDLNQNVRDEAIKRLQGTSFYQTLVAEMEEKKRTQDREEQMVYQARIMELVNSGRKSEYIIGALQEIGNRDENAIVALIQSLKCANQSKWVIWAFL